MSRMRGSYYTYVTLGQEINYGNREVLLYVLGTRRKESRELSSRSRNVKKCCSALRVYVSPREVTWNVYWEFPLPYLNKCNVDSRKKKIWQFSACS